MKKSLSLIAAICALAMTSACGHDNISSNEQGSTSASSSTTAESSASNNSEKISDSTKASETQVSSAITTVASEQAASLTEASGKASEGSENDLTYLAMRYYASRSNYRPEFCEIENDDGKIVTIHLYDIIDGHTSTCDWYYIDKNTLKGSNLLDNEIDLSETAAAQWLPDVPQRSELKENNSFCGIAYIGYAENMDYRDADPKLNDLFMSSGAVDKFRFLAQLPENYYAQTHLGTQLFLVIPKDPEAQVVVTEYDFTSDKETSRIYSSYNGSPFLLKCNYSDVSSDVRISITDNEGVHTTFSPFISLKDGTPETDCKDVVVFQLP